MDIGPSQLRTKTQRCSKVSNAVSSFGTLVFLLGLLVLWRKEIFVFTWDRTGKMVMLLGSTLVFIPFQLARSLLSEYNPDESETKLKMTILNTAVDSDTKCLIKTLSESNIDIDSTAYNSKEAFDEGETDFKTTVSQKDYDEFTKVDTGLYFVLDFDGDIEASQVTFLHDAIDFIVTTNRTLKVNGVILRLMSLGGEVCAYGLASSELERLRQDGIHLTTCVDKHAQSGGYMMACVGNHVMAAPIAEVGSIGVVSGVHNYFDLLTKFGIKYIQTTAGKYKRTVGQFTEVTEDAMRADENSVMDCYEVFRNHILKFRPNVDIDRVSTGESWHAQICMERGLGLIDSVGTSGHLIQEMIASSKTMIQLEPKETSQKSFLGKIIGKITRHVFTKIVNH